MQRDSEDESNFYLKKADLSKCPGRTDFNLLYIKYCHKKFGDKNDTEMFSKLEERTNEFMESN